MGARKFWRRSRVPKKRSRDEAIEISRGFAARDGSAVKSHSTILQRLRRQISLDYCTIPPATQARTRPSVRLTGGPLNRGFTVSSKYSWFLNLRSCEKKACISCFINRDDRFLHSFLYPEIPIYEIHIFIVSAILFFV